jgi:hypothetical protein
VRPDAAAVVTTRPSAVSPSSALSRTATFWVASVIMMPDGAAAPVTLRAPYTVLFQMERPDVGVVSSLAT